MRHSPSSRGFTPLAAVALAATLGIVGSALWLFEHESSASSRADSTRESAQLILHAAQNYKSEGGEGCPTISKLLEEQQLATTARSDDAWGNRFRIQCGDDEIAVSSPGADGQFGSSDDVRVPR
jgi:type II secretory pathway pseudopilin PulG